MNYGEYINFIEKETGNLCHQEKVALCLICCNRLFPLYSKFSTQEDWGDELVLSQCQKIATDWLYGASIDVGNLSERLNRITPDTEDFGSVLSSFALNASVAHDYLIEQIENNENASLIYVLQNCYDTVDLYVQEILNPDCDREISESDIENHPIMVKEVKWQLDMLRSIQGYEDTAEFVNNENIKPILSHA